MSTETGKDKQSPEQHPREDAAAKSATGTEAQRKGGVEPAKRQAEKDWQDSAKESGD